MAMLYHRLFPLALVLLLCPCSFVIGKSNDFSTPVYRSTTSEVRISFFATDEHNRPVPVTKADFAVVDDGLVVRDFRSLSPASETALDLVALIDSSESVAPRLPGGLREFLQLVSHSPSLSDDTVSVLTFGGLRPVLLCSGNCRSVVESKLLALRGEGATPLFDALEFGAQFVSRRRRSDLKPVILLFSDGVDTISVTSASDALQAVMGSEILIYAVDLGDPRNPSQGRFVLQRLAQETGGRYFPVREGAADVLKSVIDDLHASYVVTYPLPNRRIGFHSLRILPTHNLKLTFHCRSGYNYERTAR